MSKFSKLILILLFGTIICGCNSEEKKEDIKVDTEEISILEYGKYKNIKLDDIERVQIIKYTVGGDNPNEYNDFEEIKNIYEKLLNYKVGEETNMVCEDNTTSYVFYMNNGDKYSISIECNWFVIDGKRYLVK